MNNPISQKSRSVVTTSTASESHMLQAMALLGSLPARATEGHEQGRQAYMIALEGVTRKALFDATKRILQGGLGHAYFPSPSEFRRMCEKVAEPDRAAGQRDKVLKEMADDDARRRQVLDEATPEAKARVQAMVNEFHRTAEVAKSEMGLMRGPKLLDDAFWDRVNRPRGLPDYRDDRDEDDMRRRSEAAD